MLRTWRTFRQAPLYQHQPRHIADQRPFQAGDIVLLREIRNRSAPPILTRPLQPGKRIDNHRGVLQHDEIIGKRVRDVIRTAPLKSGRGWTEYRLHEVKLEEYVRLSKRLVTPVYPADAGLIVGLLDLRPEVYHDNPIEGPKLEILEAGTGHGALTLYLSRAIHAANTPILLPEDGKDTSSQLEEDWKVQRRAIIHTIDVSSKYSLHAQKTIKGFRRGLYYNNIDFYTTDVGAWTRKELSERANEPFLSHAILDLPNADQQLPDVAAALRCDGTLLVFNPSITQIMQCASKIKDEQIALDLETVIELPLNGGAGGREWDVRLVKPRVLQKARVEEVERKDGDSQDGDSQDGDSQDGDSQDGAIDANDRAEESSTAHKDDTSGTEAVANGDDDGWKMVCRPKVGDRIVGGGFLGVWKKKRDVRLDD